MVLSRGVPIRAGMFWGSRSDMLGRWVVGKVERSSRQRESVYGVVWV